MPRSSITSRVALLLATIAFPLAIVATWLDTVLIDTDRYVATVAPLATDPVVQTATEEAVVKEAWLALDSVEGVGAAAIERRRDQITDLLERAARRVVRDPAFATAWQDANRSAHKELIAVLAGQNTELVTGDGRVSIQLDTLLTTVFSILGDEGLLTEDVANQVQNADLEASFTLVQADDLERAQSAYRLLSALGFWLPVLWLVLVFAALLFAPEPRKTLRWLGIGAVITVLLLAIGLRVGRDQLVAAELTEDPAVVLAIWDILIVGLKTSLWASFGVAIVLVALTWLRARPAS